MSSHRYWAARAWLPGGWHERVLLEPGDDGRWERVTPDVDAPADAAVLAGPALPGLVNAHGHAFQRAFAGLAERRDGERDDFWSWRDRMYRTALRITPAQLQAVATQLYCELLRGGYTQVCEFHYLQDDAAMTWALVDAAEAAGIGLTMLPVLYERAGFDQPALRDDQRRFACDADAAWAWRTTLDAARRPLLNTGVAVHSLRAARAESIERLRTLAEGSEGPVHLHVAEQTAEVDACLAATGMRPIEWLLDRGLLDPRWQLVHATHALPWEIDAVAATGAGVVLCPSTEANLGDGCTDLPRWLAANVPLAIGSDSHVTRTWREELRWLEYGQRLLRRERNVAASAAEPSTAQRLWARVLDGGAAAAGHARWGLQALARADLLVVDLDDGALLGVPPEHLLDALVFSSPGRPWRDVMVGGRFVVRDHRRADAAGIARAFEGAMAALWDAASARPPG